MTQKELSNILDDDIISKIDNKIAQLLPHFMASGHYYKIEHE